MPRLRPADLGFDIWTAAKAEFAASTGLTAADSDPDAITVSASTGTDDA